jgi:head-tail adaptor
VISASQLRDRVTFQRRGVTSDDYGNEVTGNWADQFVISARISSPRGGSEQVLAQRLQGVRPVEIAIWNSAQARQIDPSWRAVNARNPAEIYNIHDIRDPDGRRVWLVLTCTLGAPT